MRINENSGVKLRWFTAYKADNGFKALQQPCVMKARDFFAILRWNDPQAADGWIADVVKGAGSGGRTVLTMASARNDGSSLVKIVVVTRA